MATHELTFPITDPREILKLRAGDEVTVQGHIIGIRDRTQIRIFDQGVEPPMDLRGAFLRGAFLSGAKLTGVGAEADGQTKALTQHQLDCAYTDGTTKLPPGFTAGHHVDCPGTAAG